MRFQSVHAPSKGRFELHQARTEQKTYGNQNSMTAETWSGSGNDSCWLSHYRQASLCMWSDLGLSSSYSAFRLLFLAV